MPSMPSSSPYPGLQPYEGVLKGPPYFFDIAAIRGKSRRKEGRPQCDFTAFPAGVETVDIDPAAIRSGIEETAGLVIVDYKGSVVEEMLFVTAFAAAVAEGLPVLMQAFISTQGVRKIPFHPVRFYGQSSLQERGGCRLFRNPYRQVNRS